MLVIAALVVEIRLVDVTSRAHAHYTAAQDRSRHGGSI
jgi:hypothetical protein